MDKNLRIILFFLLPLVFVLTLSLSADEKTDKVDKVFAKWDKPDSPGCAVGIVQDGKLIYKQGYGMANLELDVPIAPNSAFYTGSVSKQFVAMCIALLNKGGKLSLDDNIKKFLPEMPDYGSPITIRHLIHHTSGIRDYLTLETIGGIPLGSYHEKDVLDLILRQKALNFPPGEEHLYSNSGYFLLSVIVKRASGKSLREYAEEHIFKPLGMKNSRFHDDYRRLIKNRATGYFPAGKGKYHNFLSTFDNVGSGGLFSTVEDLFLWDQNFYHYRVGGKEIHDLMHSKGTLNNGEELDYAFAIVEGEYKGLRIVEHGGALGGYRAQILRFPDWKFSVICLANLSSINPTGLARQVADIYLADFYMDEKETGPAIKQQKAEYVSLPESRLQELQGEYISLKSWRVIRVALKDGALQATILGKKYTLHPTGESKFEFSIDDLAVQSEFIKTGDEKSFRWILSPEGQPQAVYESFHRIKLSTEELAEYIGIYKNGEIPAFIEITFRKTRLLLTLGGESAPITPLVRDKFLLSGNKLLFIRDEGGHIKALKLDAGRALNLEFLRQKK